MRALLIAATICLTVIMTTQSEGFASESPTSSNSGLLEATINKVEPGGAAITLESPSRLKGREIPVAVSDPINRIWLQKARLGDHVLLVVDDVVNPQQATAVKEISRPVPIFARFMALGFSVGLLILAAALITEWRPQKFLIGADNRYSNSQCQLAAWFGAVATVYAAAVALRLIFLGWDYIGGVELTQNLILLTGLSAFTFGGAKMITAQKVAVAAQQDSSALKAPAARPNMLTDLVQNDKGQADLGDFEMILVTLVAVLIFWLRSFQFLGELAFEPQVSLPDIDTTLLSGFGLGQGAYLIKKAASNLGEG